MNNPKRKLPPKSIYNSIKIKYLGTNLTKKLKDLYNANYKTLLGIIKENINRNIFHVHGMKDLIKI